MTATSGHSSVLSPVTVSHNIGQHRPSALIEMVRATNNITLGTVASKPIVRQEEDRSNGTTAAQLLQSHASAVKVRMRSLADDLMEKGRHILGANFARKLFRIFLTKSADFDADLQRTAKNGWKSICPEPVRDQRLT